LKLDHVGVVVTDLEDAIALYASVFGMRVTLRAGNEQLGIVAAFLEIGGLEVELIAPTRGDSMVSKFLADRGPGLHHLAYAVPDIRKALAEAKSQGLELIDEEPRIGLHGVPIAFIHPKSVGGVLTELVEHG
jgi:methylmalonyl-CoA epimerase